MKVSAYDLARGILPEPQEKPSSSDNPLRDAQYSQWAVHPYTAEFLNTLQQEYNILSDKLILLASRGGDAAYIQRIGARAKTLKDIISYGRRESESIGSAD